MKTKLSVVHALTHPEKRHWNFYFIAVCLAIVAGSMSWDSLSSTSGSPSEEHQVSSVAFRVSVTNQQTAFINMYTVRFNPPVRVFEVIGATSQPTRGNPPAAVFQIAPQQMVFFEGYSSQELAQEAMQNRRGYRFQQPPPFRNFQRGPNTLCQTNFINIEQPLRNDWNFACKNGLTIPCLQ